jgi:PIN domain nuclease of toxin-antitoxin system
MDKYLIDTQILLWHSENPDKISQAANNIINSDVELYISIVSFWEIAIKVKTGKLELPFTSFTEFYNFSVLKSKVIVMDVTKDDIAKTLELDLVHRDPFDRLIIATAIKNDMTILSSDDLYDKYPVKRIW